MTSQPEVTVVIPTHNRLTWLQRAVACVRGQLGVRTSIVVVDEASSDGTPEWLASLGAEVTCIRHDPPRGVAAARNAGLAKAPSPWVAFLDDDDLFAPTRLRRLIDAADAEQSPWAASDALVADDRWRSLSRHAVPPRAEFSTRILQSNPLPGGGSAVVVQREWILSTGGFDDSLQIYADWDMWVRLADLAAPALVNEPLLIYTWHPGGMSTTDETAWIELDLLMERYGERRRARGVSGRPVQVLNWLVKNRWRAGRRLEAIGLLVRTQSPAVCAHFVMERVRSKLLYLVTGRRQRRRWDAIIQSWVAAYGVERPRADDCR